MTEDDEIRNMKIEVCLAEIESVIFSYRTGTLPLPQFITRLARAVEQLAEAAL